MKRLLSIFILCMVCLSAGAEWKWQNPMEASFPVIQNQGWPDEIGQTYVRLPDRAKAEVREPVWNLSRTGYSFLLQLPPNNRTLPGKRWVCYAAHAIDRRIGARPVQHRQRGQVEFLFR